MSRFCDLGAQIVIRSLVAEMRELDPEAIPAEQIVEQLRDMGWRDRDDIVDLIHAERLDAQRKLVATCQEDNPGCHSAFGDNLQAAEVTYCEHVTVPQTWQQPSEACGEPMPCPAHTDVHDPDTLEEAAGLK